MLIEQFSRIGHINNLSKKNYSMVISDKNIFTLNYLLATGEKRKRKSI